MHGAGFQKKKKPADAGTGAGSRVAKLGKAHGQGQLTAMREQLTAAEKARKEARAALVEVKRRFIAAKKRDDDDVAASAVEGDAHYDKVMAAAAEVDKVLDAFVPTERENDAEAENTIYDGEKVSQEEVDELRAKLMAKDVEVDELRGSLIANNAELDELRGKLASNDTEVKKLTASLMAKDADIAALEADNADLTRMAEAAAARARARETEQALRESAAREARVAELLRASERAREETEAEAQRSRAQSEQWRKAAEEAAVVLGSVDRATAGAPAATGTPRADKGCHGSAGSRVWRMPGGAMRVLSDLWKKKKAQKK